MNDQPYPKARHQPCQHGRDQYYTGSAQPGRERCPNRAVPNRSFCEAHLSEAMARLPDRSIGDQRGLRWTTYGSSARRRA